VGGHCIGVDPYYLTTKAEELGYHPQVILAGRRINDGMGVYIAQRFVKLLIKRKFAVSGARVGILGLAFKENVPDLRNSRVPDIVSELNAYGIQPLVHDPLASAEDALHEYNLKLTNWDDMKDLDGIILAVPHSSYLKKDAGQLLAGLRTDGIFVDVKSVLRPETLRPEISYWAL
jgi:UDP-N-acetyl-D-galactosamine dehydrogenase